MRYLKCPLCGKWFITKIEYTLKGIKERADCPHCHNYSANGKYYGDGKKL